MALLLLLLCAGTAMAEPLDGVEDRSPQPRPLDLAWQMPDHQWELRLGAGGALAPLGVQLDVGFHLGLSERVEYTFPLFFSYRFRPHRRHQLQVGAGLSSLGVLSGDGLVITEDLQLLHAFALHEDLELATRVWGRLRVSYGRRLRGRVGASATLAWQSSSRVLLTFGVGLVPRSTLEDLQWIEELWSRRIAFGSAAGRPFLPQPLLRARMLGPVWLYLAPVVGYTFGSPATLDPLWSGGVRPAMPASWDYRVTAGFYVAP